MIYALAATTRHERITKITSAAEANWTVVAASIGTRLAVSIASTRIRVAQITLIERPTAIKGMTCEAFRTRANSLVAFDTTFGTDAASARARIDTL